MKNRQHFPRRFAAVLLCFAVLLCDMPLTARASSEQPEAAAETTTDNTTTGSNMTSGGNTTAEPETPPEPVTLGVTCAGLDALPKDGGTILYGIVNDTAQTFNVNIPKSLFGKGDLTITISLKGVYGMAFTDNLAGDLKDKVQIRDAAYTKDANGNNTLLTLVLDGSLTDNYLMALGTKYVPLTPAQCADIIANGYQDATVDFTVKNTAGEAVAVNRGYTLRPGTYTTSDIRIDPHQWTIGTDAAYLNWTTLSDGNPLNGYSLYATDAWKMTVPVVSVNASRLMQLGAVRIYAPGDEFLLRSVQKGAQYSGWGGVTGPFISGDFYFMDYFKSSDNFTAHNDNDGKGDYYLFEPQKPLYNNGTAVLTSAVSYYAYLNWGVKPGIDYLEGSHTYAAPDEVISYTAEAGEAGSADKNPGMIYTTMPVVRRDAVGFTPNTDYLEYTDKTVGLTTKEKFVPGASYTGKRLNTITNRGGYDRTTVGGAAQLVEYQTVKGKTTETYDFPYEIQPDAVNILGREVSIVGSIRYTVTKADGSTGTFTKDYHKYVSEIGSLSFADALAAAGPGSRISSVSIDWDQIKGYLSYATFDYTVTDQHENGSAYQNGDLLRIGYRAVCSDDNRYFDTSDNQKTYFYLSYGEQKCPWLVANGRGYQRYAVQDLDNDELVLCTDFFLKGQSGGSYRNYLDHPVIRLDGEFAGVDGMDDPTCILSGNMTLTKNMSGWKFIYSVYNTADQTTRDAEYTVPELTGDTPLTRQDLGLADTEFFTDLQISYDGIFTFAETNKVKQDSSTGDGAPAGTYDITMLLKNIKAYARPTALKSDTRLVTPTRTLDTFCTKPTMRFTALLTHEGTCDRPLHTGAGESAACESIWNYPWYIVFSNYSFTAIGPNFTVNAATAKVTQGSTATAVIDFKLASRSNENYTNMSARYQTMPWVTPEAIYIELTDNQFDVDPENAAFQASLAAHGMTADDVSVVKTGDGKRWLKLATAGNGVITGKSSDSVGIPHDNLFTIALQAWNGASVAVHHPFGEVWYDVSGLLTKYDGSEASGYVTENFQGAVPDTHGLLGDQDTTTPRLWKGDMSSVAVEVLRNTVTGVSLLPGKNGEIDLTGKITFEPDESKNLLASSTIKAPETELYNYTTITYIPRKGDITRYTQLIEGKPVDGEKTCEFTMYLEGPVYTYRSSAENPTKVAYSYSKDGKTWVTEAEVGKEEWHEYRYIKTVVDIIAPYQSVETRYPLSSGYKKQVGDFHDYVGGTWSYQDGLGSTANVTSGRMMYGEFVQTDFILRGPAGSIWYDTNENGFNDNGEKPAENIALRLYSPKEDIEGYDGDRIPAGTLIDETKSAADGSYELRSYIAMEGQILEVVMPDAGVVVTRRTSKIFDEDKNDMTVRADDSDIVRADQRQTLPAFPKPMLKNIGCGLIRLPVITANEVRLHVKSPVTEANACGAVCTSDNPERPNPPVVFGTEDAADAPALVDDKGVVTPKHTGKLTMGLTAADTLVGTAQEIPADTVRKNYDVIIYVNVLYDANTGTGVPPTDPQGYYPSDDKATDSVMTASGASLTKQGYLLAGWSEKKDSDYWNEKEYFRPMTVFQTGARTEDITLYAVWKPVPPNIPVWNPQPARIDPPVTKVILGDRPEKAERFVFLLKPVTDGAPMPDGTVNSVKTVTIQGAGTAEFGTITYQAEHAGKTYEYEVSETPGKAAGYQYDAAVYRMRVTVTVNPQGNLDASVSWTDGSGQIATAAVFRNRYQFLNIPEPKVPGMPTKAPQTGDRSPILLWVLVLTVSAVCLAGLLLIGRKKRKNGEEKQE